MCKLCVRNCFAFFCGWWSVVDVSIHHHQAGVKPCSDLFVSRKKPLSPSVFKYTVRMDKHSEPFTVTASRIR